MEQKNCRIGCIGLGGRGLSMTELLLDVPGVTVPAVCDIIDKRLERGVKSAEKKQKGKVTVTGYSDYKKMLESENLDAVYIATTWTTHIPIAIDAMKAGCHAGLEAGGASSLEECFDLVKTSEETGKFCMLLENCCYDRKELAVLNMVKQGLFGEIVHLEGGYRHDLRDEIVLGRENMHGRLKNFMSRNGELYPTHEIGPLSKLIGINRGNRFISLSSVSSKSRGLDQWIKDNKGEKYDLYGYNWNCGDVTSTFIKCANGETITLHHDCCLPRPYSREFTVQGTKGIFKEAPDDTDGVIYLEGISKERHKWESFNKLYRDKYEHPLWKSDKTTSVTAGHGGMDYLVLAAFAESAAVNGKPPIDVYDTAAWMAVTPLSEKSVALGGAAVAFPDFTNGKWINREQPGQSKYSLDKIFE